MTDMPNNLPQWDETEVGAVEPDATHKGQGFTIDPNTTKPEKPKYQHFNFWMNLVYKWVKWVRDTFAVKGVLEYRTTVNYPVDSVVTRSGKFYICKIVNGPNSSLVDPTLDTGEIAWANIPRYSQLLTGAKYNVGTGDNEIPLNFQLGTAARYDVGSAASNVPRNSDLGSASKLDVSTGPSNLWNGSTISTKRFILSEYAIPGGGSVVVTAPSGYAFDSCFGRHAYQQYGVYGIYLTSLATDGTSATIRNPNEGGPGTGIIVWSKRG